MIERPCLSCGVLITSGTRCPQCTSQAHALTRHASRGTSRWKAHASRLIGAHVRHYGYVCPGDDHHAAHPSRDLTIDHILPVAQGGDVYERANTRVLCREANSGRRVGAPTGGRYSLATSPRDPQPAVRTPPQIGSGQGGS